jgi:hypothetical protein
VLRYTCIAMANALKCETRAILATFTLGY